MTKPKKANGRPTIFTETLAAKICQRIADGESIRAICSDPNMPSTTAIFRWIANGKYDGFRQLYEASMQIRLETAKEAVRRGARKILVRRGSPLVALFARVYG